MTFEVRVAGDAGWTARPIRRWIALAGSFALAALAAGCSGGGGGGGGSGNQAPVARILEGALLANPDQRRGIPIPCEVIDADGDPVELVIQWRPAGQPFADLPGDAAAVRAILGDPALRRAHRICSELPRAVEGHAIPLGPKRARLPELAGPAADVIARGLAGRELEILRASRLPQPLAASWAANPLHAPVAALPVGDGRRALVLDRPASGTWRLIEIELATGALVAHGNGHGNGSGVGTAIASGSGQPSALALEPGEERALVASDESGAWKVERVELASGSTHVLARQAGAIEAGTIRGIASLGAGASLVTVGGSLLRLAHPGAGPGVVTAVASGLRAPWGIALDPLREGWAYVAERDWSGPLGDGRVIAVDLDTHTIAPVVAQAPEPGQPAFPSPRDLVFGREGHRLLALCDLDPSSDKVELRAFDFRGEEPNEVFVVAGQLPPGAVSLAAGPDGLRLCVQTSGDLWAGGGVEQKRRIASFAAADCSVAVDAPFAPALAAGSRWRIQDSLGSVRGSPEGTRATFVWDGAEASGELFFRVVPIDPAGGRDVGIGDETSAPKRILSPLEGPELALTSPDVVTPRRTAVADIDGDGDLDIASANFEINTLTVFWQTAPRSFDPVPTVLRGPKELDGPASIAAADLDQDGDLDLVSANQAGNSLTWFRQVAPGAFDPDPEIVGNVWMTNTPITVAAADVDGDGDQDLVCANFVGADLTVFWQIDHGVFDPDPTRVGASPILHRPISVVPADVDLDGDVDLACANLAGDTLTVFWQVGKLAFDPTPTVLGGPATTHAPIFLAVADVDSDGDPDLVSANQFGDTLTVFWQAGAGVFDPVPKVLGGFPTLDWPTSVAVADVDRDGRQDILASDLIQRALRVFRQVAPGEFAEPTTFSRTPGIEGPVALTPADVDGDGDLDAVGADEFDHALKVYWHAGPGAFDSSSTVEGYPSLDSPVFAVASDVDRDGDPDLVAANRFGRALTITWQTAPGVFDPRPDVIGHLPSSAGRMHVAVCDLDGDGDGDVISASEAGDELAVAWQTAAGVFSALERIADPPAIDGPTCVVAADVDGDGDLDLVAANRDRDALTISWQLAPGVFDPVPSAIGGAPVVDGPVSVAAADLDRDGDLDLVSGNELAHTLTWFRQTSPGVFAPAAVIAGHSVVDRPVSVAALDVDQDGDVDVVVADNERDELLVFRQLAPGVFDASPMAVGAGSGIDGPISVAAADVDQDGDLDLLSSNEFSHDATVFFQTVPGVFDPVPAVIGTFPRVDGNVPLAPCDVDLDGDVDLVSGSQDGGVLTVIWNAH